MKQHHIFQSIVLSLGMAISLLVMLGWLIQSKLIVQIYADFHPMQFNTALGFLLVNAALFAIQRGWSRLGLGIVSVHMLLFTLTLLEHLFAINLGIDTLFIEPFITEEAAAPGRPGANTTFCFWLMGISVWLLTWTGRKPEYWVGAISATVLGMSFASLWGYAEGLEGLAGWKPYLSGMAVHTSIAFTLCASVLLSMLISRRSDNRKWYSALRPVHASIPLLILSLTVWNAMYQWDLQRIQREQRYIAQSMADSVGLGFESRSNAFKRLAQRWEANTEMSEVVWRADAENFIEDMPALVMLGLRVEEVQFEVAEPRLGDIPLMYFEQQAESEISQDPTRLVWIDDQAYIIDRFMLMQGGRVAGELIAVLDLGVWFAKYAADMADGTGLVIVHKNLVVYESTPGQSIAGQPLATAELELAALDDPFELALIPNSVFIARARSPWTTAILVGGIFASFVLWLIMKQALLLAESRSRISETAQALRVKSQQLSSANDELSELNQDMEQFNRAVSHDLNSPLFSIKSYLSMIQTALQNDDVSQASEFTTRMVHVTDRMSITVDSLLSVSAIGNDTSQHIDIKLKSLVDETLEYIAGDLQASNAKVIVEDPLHDVHGDRHLLGNVIQNFVINAIKYARTPDQELKIRVGTDMHGDSICLFVEDNGPGIKVEHRSRAFEMFERLENTQAQGTGLGLSIVSRVARVHGGKAWIEDSDLGGAKFCITVPKAHTDLSIR